VIVGVALTVIDLVPVLEHPAAEVPVTVKIVEVDPVSVTGEPVEALNPVVGDQVYVVAPDAPRVVVLPLHIVVAPPFITIVGSGLTVIVCVVVFVQPAVLVPVIV
jgi:hypothetical protein